MDAIDILGSLLGHKSSRGGKGSDVLKDIFKGGSRSSSYSDGSRAIDIDREAKELEELLNVANDRHAGVEPPSRPAPRPRPAPGGTPVAPSGRNTETDQQRSIILVRAMVSAAKADGRIDQSEQSGIIDHLSNPPRENIEFLRQESKRPLDTRDFAMSVPVGIEQQVYAMSLIAIDLETSQEAKYLMELAELLLLPNEVREKIHQRLGAPSIY